MNKKELEIQEKFKTLDKYCVTDVEAEYAISQRLGELPERELKIWLLDQKINEYGVPVDTEVAKKAIKVFDRYYKKLTEELIDITDGEVEGITKLTKLKEWIKSLDEELPDLKAETVEKFITIVKNPKVKRALEIRQALANSSVKKYKRMLDMADTDNRIRDTLRYHGTSTGRWSGKGIQPQNMFRGKIKDMDEEIKHFKTKTVDQIIEENKDTGTYISSLARGAICASPNKKLLVADYSSIEARILAWLVDDIVTLERYRAGVDLYKCMASNIFTVPIEEVTSAQRQLGKQAVLGAGYGMGFSKFKLTCKSYGIEVSDELAERVIRIYRRTYIDVVRMWRDQEQAAIKAISNPREKYKANFCTWHMPQKEFLVCELPSGRSSYYPEPTLKRASTPRGEIRLQVSYKTSVNNNFKTTRTYGGKIVENIAQATARDLLADALLSLDKNGFTVVSHVHDEIIAEVPENNNELTLDKFCSIIKEVPPWAKGCPIEVEGWEGKHYRK